MKHVKCIHTIYWVNGKGDRVVSAAGTEPEEAMPDDLVESLLAKGAVIVVEAPRRTTEKAVEDKPRAKPGPKPKPKAVEQSPSSPRYHEIDPQPAGEEDLLG